jgi:hypothetical protein
MVVDLNFVFCKSQRDRFRSGQLVREWRERYPKLFDKDDERVLLTDHQRLYNFYEWLAAVLIFESMGYLSLVAKYTAKSHSLKHAPLRNSLPSIVADWVFTNEPGQPDLFVYSTDHKDWFFCEVKGPGDRMRLNQEKWKADFEAKLREQTGESSNRYRIFRLAQIDA